MLSRSSRLASRGLATKAGLVKGLAAEQKAVLAAVNKLGPGAPFAKVNEVMQAEPHASTFAKVREGGLSWSWSMLSSAPTKPAVTVAVAGKSEAASETLYRIAAGEMLGPDTPVDIKVVGGDAAVIADVEACGFPLLKGIASATSVAGAPYALVLEGDAAALAGKAEKGALVAVAGVGNAAAAAKGSAGSVTAITREAQMAAEFALAKSAGVDASMVDNVISWGEGFADISHATIGGKWALKDGGAALPATGDVSPAMSAEAAVSHMRDWACGSGGKWVSMGVPAVGDYGMGEGFFYSVPCVTTAGSYKRVGGVTLTAEVASAMEASRAKLSA